MERSEPTFVPEWLKGTGNVNVNGGGSGSTSHHFTSHSDDHGVSLPSRNRSSLSFSDYDNFHSSADRTTSSYFRRSSSSNGSMLYEKDVSTNSRSYSSFNRSHRDRREKERSLLGTHRDYDSSDISMLTSRIEKDMLRRSQSMISGNRGEALPKRAASNLNGNNNHIINGVGVSKKSSISKVMFERDFPHLGAEERQEVPDRASSPCLPSAVQSLPMSIAGNGWTSALAEVPAMIGNNSVGLLSSPQAVPATSFTIAPSTTTGLNMAETLAQAPSRARTAPQASTETQRLEELAIKQSRQLIPMTPSMPKNLVPTSEKQKPKAGARSDTSIVNKVAQQQNSSSHLINHSMRGGPPKSDVAKLPSHGGKLLVLKSPRDNGISVATSDGSKSTNPGRIVSNQLAVTPSAANNPKPVSAERKAPALTSNLNPTMEKKPTMSQAQSRNDFFNLMRKKTSTNFPSVPVTSSATSAVLEKSGELTTELTAVSPHCNDTPDSNPSSSPDFHTHHEAVITSNGGDGESQPSTNEGDKPPNSDELLYPDEEEAAFLRSLGWEENAGEEEGLTEEEINAFYKEYVKLRPSSMKEPKLALLRESHGGIHRASSSDFKSEA